MLKRFENKNLYEVLGVSHDATDEEIGKVYKDLCQIYHPESTYYDDVIKEPLRPEHHEVFRIITDAFNVLSDSEARAKYNDQLFYQSVRNLTSLSNIKFESLQSSLEQSHYRGNRMEEENEQQANEQRLLKVSVESTSGYYKNSGKKKSRSKERFENEWTQSIPSVSQIIQSERSPARSLMIVVFGAVAGCLMGGLLYYLIKSF
jgi:DnaJ-class molecular chaperone